jgi:hypothetical protein
MLQKFLVYVRHFLWLHEMNTEFVTRNVEVAFENVARDAAEQGNVQCAGALAILQQKNTPHQTLNFEL